MAAEKAGMNKSTVGGLFFGVGSVVLSGAMELNHLNPEGITAFLKPSALLVIFGGTIGCTMLATPWDAFTKIITFIKISFKQPHYEIKEMVSTFVTFSEKARREGLLSLESDIEQVQDQFLKNGLQLLVDGTSPETITEILDSDIDTTKIRHKEGQEIFTQMGGYSPTMGIVGTVLGLIAALTMASQGMETSKVVGAIATAFIATFYGIGVANLVFLPLGGKLKALDEEEARYREVVRQGILSIVSGDNPRIVLEKLAVYLHESARKELMEEKSETAA